MVTRISCNLCSILLEKLLSLNRSSVHIYEILDKYSRVILPENGLEMDMVMINKI